MLLERFKAEVSRNPETDVTSYAAELRKIAKEKETALIRTLMLNLYAQDARSLRRDLTKSVVLGTAQVPPSQRAALLHAFMGVVSLYFDSSELLAVYDKVEDACKGGTPALDT